MAQTKTEAQAQAKRGRKPGQVSMPKAVKEAGLGSVSFSQVEDEHQLIRPASRYAEQVAWSFEHQRWLQALATGYEVAQPDGQPPVKVSPADHAKAILAELRKAADQLGCGLRTLPFAETDDGIVVQVKARPRKERKEAKATASKS